MTSVKIGDIKLLKSEAVARGLTTEKDGAKLANLEDSQGTLDLNVKSLNNDYIDINNDVIYYFISSDNKVVLY